MPMVVSIVLFPSWFEKQHKKFIFADFVTYFCCHKYQNGGVL